MLFDTSLTPGKILRRYKRFLCDIQLETGDVVTAHCPNSGSMRGCWEPGWKVLLSRTEKPTRKHKYTLEMTHNGTCWIGINTHLANSIAYEAIVNEAIPELRSFDHLRREVRYGMNSRIDILGTTGDKLCYIEVKNTTLVTDDGVNRFPDSPTERGRKHLRELMHCVREGHRAAMLYVVQRSDGEDFGPADEIDPEYGKLLREALKAGVEVMAYRSDVSPEGVELTGERLTNLL